MNLFLLATALVCFPPVMDLWNAGPLTEAVLRTPNPPPCASTAQLNAQVRIFRQLDSTPLRSRMALEFSNARNPEAFKILMKLLKTEKNPFVRDNILTALLNMKHQGFAVRGNDGLFADFLQSGSPLARAAAMELYLTCGTNPDPARILTSLGKEHSAMVLNRLIELLRPFAIKNRMVDSPVAGQSCEAQIARLYDETPQGNILLRAFAAELAAQLPGADGSAVVEKALKDPSVVIRMQAARGLAANSDAVKAFAAAAQDEHPAVRLAAARIIVTKNGLPNPERVKVLISLLNDPVPAVRTAAAKSLGTASAEAADHLSDRWNDPEIAVRRAVAKALIELKPSAAIHARAVETAEQNPICRRQVLEFLVQTGDRDHFPNILRWIGQSKDPLFLREAAAALGKLNCRTGDAALNRLADSKDPAIRQAAAVSMGQLKLPATFPTLIKLCRDREIKVAEAAFFAMFQIRDPSFLPEFERMTGRFTDDGANCRAIACRALIHYELKPRTIANLTKLILKPCIRIPMSPPQMDVDHVRISALLLLREWAGKGNPGAVRACSSIMNELDRAKDDSELRTPEFDEYRRQMEAAFQGKKVRPKEIEPPPLSFTTAPAPAEK